jgi:hypothetical protein
MEAALAHSTDGKRYGVVLKVADPNLSSLQTTTVEMPTSSCNSINKIERPITLSLRHFHEVVGVVCQHNAQAMS